MVRERKWFETHAVFRLLSGFLRGRSVVFLFVVVVGGSRLKIPGEQQHQQKGQLRQELVHRRAHRLSWRDALALASLVGSVVLAPLVHERLGVVVVGLVQKNRDKGVRCAQTMRISRSLVVTHILLVLGDGLPLL